MKRRFNYTGRKKIFQEQVAIKLRKENESIKSFDVQLGLDDTKLPENASIYIEAHHRTDFKRYYFGSVGIRQLPDTSLSELGNIDYLQFRVKIVDEAGESGLILAEADRIRASEEGGEKLRKRCILPVEFDKDLGQQVWRLDLSGTQPVLEFNRRIPYIRHLAKSDTSFFFHVYPVVIRTVLSYMFFIEGLSDLKEPDQDWCKDWLGFVKSISTEDPPELVDPEENGYDDFKRDILNWIDRVVEEFCAVHTSKWHHFMKQIGEV